MHFVSDWLTTYDRREPNHCEASRTELSSRTKKRSLLDNITLTLTITSHTRPASFTGVGAYCLTCLAHF